MGPGAVEIPGVFRVRPVLQSPSTGCLPDPFGSEGRQNRTGIMMKHDPASGFTRQDRSETPADEAASVLDDLRRQLAGCVPETLMFLAWNIPPGYDALAYAARLVLSCEEQRPQTSRAVYAIHREIRSVLKAAWTDARSMSRHAFGRILHARGILRDLLAGTGMDQGDAACKARDLVIALYEGSVEARAEIDTLCARSGLSWDTVLADESYCRDLPVQRALFALEAGYERAAAESRAILDAERDRDGEEGLAGRPATGETLSAAPPPDVQAPAIAVPDRDTREEPCDREDPTAGARAAQAEPGAGSGLGTVLSCTPGTAEDRQEIGFAGTMAPGAEPPPTSTAEPQAPGKKRRRWRNRKRRNPTQAPTAEQTDCPAPHGDPTRQGAGEPGRDSAPGQIIAKLHPDVQDGPPKGPARSADQD